MAPYGQSTHYMTVRYIGQPSIQLSTITQNAAGAHKSGHNGKGIKVAVYVDPHYRSPIATDGLVIALVLTVVLVRIHFGTISNC